MVYIILLFALICVTFDLEPDWLQSFSIETTTSQQERHLEKDRNQMKRINDRIELIRSGKVALNTDKRFLSTERARKQHRKRKVEPSDDSQDATEFLVDEYESDDDTELNYDSDQSADSDIDQDVGITKVCLLFKETIVDLIVM